MYEYTETSLVSGFTIQKESIFFQNGSFVESGLIEHIAQSIALHTGYEFFLKKEPAPIGYIGSIKNIEILKLPILGDEIQTTITIIQEFAGITLVEAVTKLNTIEITRGQMKTALAK